MKQQRRNAFNNFSKGRAAMTVADREMKLGAAAVKVAGAQGMGSAIEYVRQTKAGKKAARKQAKQARRRNR